MICMQGYIDRHWCSACGLKEGWSVLPWFLSPSWVGPWFPPEHGSILCLPWGCLWGFNVILHQVLYKRKTILDLKCIDKKAQMAPVAFIVTEGEFGADGMRVRWNQCFQGQSQLQDSGGLWRAPPAAYSQAFSYVKWWGHLHVMNLTNARESLSLICIVPG